MKSGCVYLSCLVSLLADLEHFFHSLHVTVQETHHKNTHVRATNELRGFREVVVLDCGGHKLPFFARLFDRYVASEIRVHVTDNLPWGCRARLQTRIVFNGNTEWRTGELLTILENS